VRQGILPAHLADRMSLARAKLHKILKQSNPLSDALRDQIFDELGMDHVRAKISVALLHDPHAYVEQSVFLATESLKSFYLEVLTCRRGSIEVDSAPGGDPRSGTASLRSVAVPPGTGPAARPDPAGLSGHNAPRDHRGLDVSSMQRLRCSLRSARAARCSRPIYDIQTGMIAPPAEAGGLRRLLWFPKVWLHFQISYLCGFPSILAIAILYAHYIGFAAFVPS
jgi:hypothetical protein